MERLAEIACWRLHPVLFASLLLVTLLSIFDYYLTLVILGLGGAEANPLFCGLLPRRPELCYWLKFGLTTAGVMVLAALSHLRVARAAAYAMVSIYGSLIVYELILIRVLNA